MLGRCSVVSCIEPRSDPILMGNPIIAVADLQLLFASERLGVAMFSTLQRLSINKSKIQKWQLLLALEQNTLAEVRALASRQGLPIPSTPVATITGVFYGILFTLLPWKLNMRLLRSGTRAYLPLFERLKAQHSDPVFGYLLAHEQALKVFAEQELHGNSSNAASAIRQVLGE